MFFHSSHHKIVAIVVSLLSVSNMARAYNATEITCFQTITQDTILNNNVVNCPCGYDGFALKIDGAHLNLNGHNVSCETEYPNNVCIEMAGNSPGVYSSQEGSTLMECGRGVQVKGNTTTTPLIEHVSIQKTQFGIYSTVNGTKIKNVTIKDSGAYGVNLFEANNSVIESTTVLGNGHALSSCIQITNSRDNQISNSVIKNCDGNGIYVLHYWTDTSNVVVKNNVIANCAKNGIKFFWSEGIIENNEISDTGARAIDADCDHCVDTKIRNNKIQNSGSNLDDSIYAVHVNGKTVINNNTISNILNGGGILAFSPGSHTIENNEISDCGVSNANGIRVGSSGNKIHDNVIKRCNTGIRVNRGAVDNLVTENKVSESASGFDFVDKNIRCASNKYIRNSGRGSCAL